MIRSYDPFRISPFGGFKCELFDELNSQRQTGEFLDIVIKVQGIRFPCHRAVLSSTSYFKAILSSNLVKDRSSNRPVIELSRVAPFVFSKILDFVYTGKITISKDDVEDILQAAHELKFHRILNYCRQFMQQTLCPSNCLVFLRLAKLYGFSNLKKEARDKAVTHFSEVKETDSFLTLSSEELADLLGDTLLQVTYEDEVVPVVLRWLDHDPDSRKQALPTILKEIRLCCVRVSVLKELESHPVIRESPECLAIVTTAKEQQFTRTSTQQLTADSEEDGAKAKHRLATLDNLLIIVGGWKLVNGDLLETFYGPEKPIPLQSIICVDPDDKQWYHITDLPKPVLGYMSVTTAGRHLYVTGGRVAPLTGYGPHGVPSRQAFQYNFLLDTWTQLPDMPRGRAGHQSVVVDGKLFLVGGDEEPVSNETTSRFSIDCYDLEEGTWIEPTTAPPIDTSSNANHKVATCGGKLVLFNIFMKRHGGNVCVYALNMKDRQWVYSQIAFQADEYEVMYFDKKISFHWNTSDISANAIDDKLYFDVESCSYMYAYDVKTESLTRVKSKAALRIVKAFCRERFRSILINGALRDTMDHVHLMRIYDRKAIRRALDARRMQLPFALFGYSFLGTKKTSIGWYCRDLTKLWNGNDDDETDSKVGSACSVRNKKGYRCFIDDSHAQSLLGELECQQTTGEYTDVVLEVEGQYFRCHRAVLASTRYFKTMFSPNFKESNSKVVQLRGICPKNLSKILTFLYKRSIRITKRNVQDILQAAHMLQIDKIIEFCKEVINSNIHISNCIGVMRLANLYGFSDLEQRAIRLALMNFWWVRHNDEFLSLSVDEFRSTYTTLLKVTDEYEVVTSVLPWLDHDPESRKTAMSAILQEIPLSCVRVSVLERFEFDPLIRESPECLAKITAAREKHLRCEDTGADADSDETRKRNGVSNQLAIIVGGWKVTKQWFKSKNSTPAKPLQSIICLDPERQQCYYVTDLPTPVSGYMSVTSAGRHLYITGGRVHLLIGQGPHCAPSRQAFRYDFLTDTWTQLPDMPRGRAEHRSIVADEKLFLIGGDVDQGEGKSLLDIDCFDLEQGVWNVTIVADTHRDHIEPFATWNFVVTALKGKLVVIEILEGYENEESVEIARVHSLDVKTLCWTSVTSDTDQVSDGLEYADEKIDILSIAVDDRVYFRGRRFIYDLYAYDVNENALITDIDDEDFKCNFFLATRNGNYGYNGRYYKYIMDTMSYESYEGYESTKSVETRLPFALLGHSYFGTKKTSVGWYCRDLEKLRKEDEETETDDNTRYVY